LIDRGNPGILFGFQNRFGLWLRPSSSRRSIRGRRIQTLSHSRPCPTENPFLGRALRKLLYTLQANIQAAETLPSGQNPQFHENYETPVDAT